MKKLVVLAGVLAFLTCGANAWATFTLTFDGSQDLTGGAGYTTAQDIIVTNQYNTSNYGGPYGVTFSAFGTVIPGTSQALGGATFGYSNGTTATWYDDSTTAVGNGNLTNWVPGYVPTSNFIGFNKGAIGTTSYYAGAEITFGSSLTSLSFDLFKPGNNPGQSATVTIELFNTLTNSQVGTTGTVTAYNNQPWAPFSSSTLDTTGTAFNAVVVSSSGRFMMDNLDGTSATPIPNTAWLLGAAGLVGVLGIKRRHLA